jgi:hypothetical protein
MGFKVTVRKNGATHGESHYTSEAVAAGMVAKMRDAGADVSVARCNGTGCGCDGVKANPKSKPKEPPVWEREGHSQRNPRRNGTTAANIAASRSLVHRSGLVRNGSKQIVATHDITIEGQRFPKGTAFSRKRKYGQNGWDYYLPGWSEEEGGYGWTADSEGVLTKAKANPRRNAGSMTAAHAWKPYLEERATHSTWLLSTSGLAEGTVVTMSDNGVRRRALVIRAAPGLPSPVTRGMIFQSANIRHGKGRGPRHGALADILAKANPRRNGKAKLVGMDDTVQFGQIAFYSTTPKRVIVKRKMHDGFREQPGYAYRGYYLVQEYTFKSFDEGGPLVPKAGGRWTVLHESGLSVAFNAPTLKGAQAVVDGLRETEGGRAIATTPAKDVMQYEDDVKRLYGRSFTRNRRNGAAKTETFAVARKRIFNEFGAAGWKLSSPTLLVLHATSPDGRTRAWFKPQAVYYTTVGKGQRHDAGDGHTVSYSLDIRTVPPGVFVPWFIKNFDK